MKILKKFRDGTLLVEEGNGATSIMRESEYRNLQLKDFELGKELLSKISKAYPHCSFSFKEEISRDFLWIEADDQLEAVPLTNFSLTSLEFWMRDTKMSLNEILVYIDTKMLRDVFEKINAVEFDRCRLSMAYFFKNYAKQINKN